MTRRSSSGEKNNTCLSHPAFNITNINLMCGVTSLYPAIVGTFFQYTDTNGKKTDMHAT